MAELRLEVLFEAERTGMTVAEVCRRYGISRQTYYPYRLRFLAEGLAGLEDRSRRPLHGANQIPVDLEFEIVEMRKNHPRWGARRIRTELTRAGVEAPAVSTVHQVLVRNGLVAVRPPRPPKADQRFEREISNDLWQIDANRVLQDWHWAFTPRSPSRRPRVGRRHSLLTSGARAVGPGPAFSW